MKAQSQTQVPADPLPKQEQPQPCVRRSPQSALPCLQGKKRPSARLSRPCDPPLWAAGICRREKSEPAKLGGD